MWTKLCGFFAAGILFAFVLALACADSSTAHAQITNGLLGGTATATITPTGVPTGTATATTTPTTTPTNTTAFTATDTPTGTPTGTVSATITAPQPIKIADEYKLVTGGRSCKYIRETNPKV